MYPHKKDVADNIVESRNYPTKLPQDFTLFVLKKGTDIGVWKRTLDWVTENGGMALLITHPDYMKSGIGKPGFDEYPALCYSEFLEHVKSRYEGQYWHALPCDIAAYCHSKTTKEGTFA